MSVMAGGALGAPGLLEAVRPGLAPMAGWRWVVSPMPSLWPLLCHSAADPATCVAILDVMSR